MFDEMQNQADKSSIIMTVYVDDVTFSCDQRISREFKRRILKIVEEYGFQTANSKVRTYTKNYPKLVTGVIIDPNGHLTVKNSLRKSIIDEHDKLRNNPDNFQSRQRLRGLVTAARQVDRNAFPAVHRYAFDREKHQ